MSAATSTAPCLHRTTLTLVTEKLINYGNQVSDDHRTALDALCGLGNDFLVGRRSGRIRFALPCGMGKTTWVRCMLKSIAQLRLPYRIVVASSKVEELCRLYHSLVTEDEISTDLIGIQHSYAHDPVGAKAGRPGFAALPSHNHDAQFLLVTHASAKSGKERAWMSRCDLVLFDESLIVGEAHQLTLASSRTRDSVKGELGSLAAMAQRDPSLKSTLASLTTFVDQLLDAVGASSAHQVAVVSTGAISSEWIAHSRISLADRLCQFPLLRQLLDWAELAEELRVFSSEGEEQVLITYTVSVPEAMNNVIVLDASDPVRELVSYDHRMQRAEDVLPELANLRARGGLPSIKYHDQVQVYVAADPGGRHSMTKSFREGAPWPVEKVVRLVQSKPDESFLVFTFKPRERDDIDFEKRLRAALTGAGIGQDRVSVLTWGNETGTNDYAQYQNVVLLGVVHKPQPTLAGAYLGQVNNLRCPMMREVSRRLIESECRHSIYQAMNRIRMRQVEIVDGLAQAKACSVYVWHADAALESELAKVLPGCPGWLPWREPGEDLKVPDLAKLIVVQLRALVDGRQYQVTLRALKRLVCPEVPLSTWARARDQALALMPQWTKERSSLVFAFPPVTVA